MDQRHTPSSNFIEFFRGPAKASTDGGPKKRLILGPCATLRAQIVINPSLNNPVKSLLAVMSALKFSQRTLTPAVAAVHRFFRIGPVNVIGRTFIKLVNQVRPQLTLDFDGFFRAEQQVFTVPVRLESCALLRHRHQAFFAGLIPTLDFIGNRSMPHGKNLESAGIGHHRPVPFIERVQAAHFFNQIRPRLNHQVIGIPQNDIGTGFAHLPRGQVFYGTLGAAENVIGGFNCAMRGCQPPQPRPAGWITVRDVEGKVRIA